MTFENKVVLVTGAGSGSGRATARRFAERGADVLVQDISAAGAQETALLVRETGQRAEVSVCDVADVQAMRNTVVETAFAHVDILVNNAGIPSDRCTLEEVTEEMFERTVDVHVKGTLFTTQAVIPGMKERRFGKIVNLSSIQGISGFANAATYNGAKAAVLSMAQGWARELAPWHINVNVIAPGHVMTNMPMSRDSPEELQRQAQSVPFLRFGQPEEMASTIVFLCSPEAQFITGQVVSPNGGFMI